MWQTHNIFLFLAISLAMSSLGTWWVLRWRLRFGLDEPDSHRKSHDAPTPRLGGLSIFITLAIGIGVLLFRRPDFFGAWLPLILGNSIIFAVGFIDDLKPLGAKVKLLGQIGAALVVYSMGVSIDIVSNPFGEGSISIGWWSLPVTILWLIAIPNFINLIDGMDGLATGLGLFLCLTLAVIGFDSGRPDVVLVALIMSGALGGFLPFNLPPARIFLGDGGAYLIGFFIASVSLMSSNKGSIFASLLVVMVALGVPIMDTAFAILRRGLRGMPLFRADAEHIHHRLITLGFTKGQALAVLYAVAVVLSLAGLTLLIGEGQGLPVIGTLVVLLALFAVRWLGYVRSWKTIRQQIRETLARRREREYLRAHGRLLEMEVERCGSAGEFANLLIPALGRLDLMAAEAADLKKLEIRCLNGSRCVLHRPSGRHTMEEWQFRGEILEPALSRALERWNDLPGIEVLRKSPPQENNEPDVPTTAPTTLLG